MSKRLSDSLPTVTLLDVGRADGRRLPPVNIRCTKLRCALSVGAVSCRRQNGIKGRELGIGRDREGLARVVHVISKSGSGLRTRNQILSRPTLSNYTTLSDDLPYPLGRARGWYGVGSKGENGIEWEELAMQVVHW